MQGQGESQPGESVDTLDDLANALMGEQDEGAEAVPEESEEEAEESEEEESEGEETEESEEAEPDPTIKLTHDGKEVELKLSEAKELAQKGFDYSQKTMALAEERKAAEAERAKASEFRARHEQAANETLARLEHLRSYMQEQLGQPPSIELAYSDAPTFLAQKELYEQRKGQLQQAEAAIAHLTEQRQRERQADLSQRAQATVAALKNTLPGWNENTLPELEKYVDGYGLNLESAEAGFLHKGLWEMAHKAKAYDAIQAQKAQMKPKQQLQKVAKPAAVNAPGKAAERAKREAEFNKNPSVDALARLLG